MNKRDLIKALFKDPTIKALYESGYFNATDINRAILTEARSMSNMEREANQILKQIQANSKEATANTKELEDDATKALRATAVAANKMGNNSDKKSTLADLADAQKALRARGAKLPQSKQAAQAAVKTEPSSDDKISAQQLDNLGQNAAQAYIEVDKIAQTPLNNDTVAQVAQQLKKDLVNPDEPFLDDDPQKVADAVKAAQQAGEGGQSDKIEEYVQIFDEFVSQDAKDKFNQVLGIQPNESDTPANLIAKAFAAYYLMETGTLNEAEGDLPEYETHAKKFVTEMELNSQQKQALEDILNNQAFHDAVAAVRDSIKTSGEDAAGDEGDTGTASLDQWLSDKPEDIQKFVNSNELFKTNLAKAYSEAVDAKPESESETQQTTAEPADSQTAPDATQQTAPVGESINRALSGIYLINEQEEQEGEGTGQEGGPVDVSDVRTMLAKLQELFNTDNININVEEIWTASQEDSANIDQQQKEALEQQADVNQDKDLSSMEQEELDASWKTTLDEFFGKSAESSSFMNQLLLRKQSDLLYGMIKTLTQIIVGNRKPKTGGGVEAASLTDQGNEEDNNQPETQDTPAPAPEPELQQSTGTPPGKRDDVLEEQVVNEIFDKLFGGKKGGNETVQLSRKSTKNMRQHLEAMVTLLRSLKSDINDYSQFSTRESADPRFDGSSLKKALDAKLAVTQKRIAMLTKQIEISVADQDSDVENFSEHLTEDKKSERRLKVQKVREVYNEMRRLYIDSLMVDLENGKVKKAKRSAQGMKDYILNEKEFLSYFPKGMIVGTSVMTLSEAHKSMSLIIKKFIDTIRDVVTITKSQEVSKEQLAVAASDLLEIAKQIEALFKVPSQIDKAFMEKYVKLAASDPSSSSLSDEKPSAMGQFGAKALEKLKQMFSWMSDETKKMISTIQSPLPVYEPMLKLIDDLPKPDEWKNIAIQNVLEAEMWLNTLEDNEQQALAIYAKYLLDNKAIVSEDRAGRNAFYGAMNTAGVKFQDGRGTRKAFKLAYKAVRTKSKEMAQEIDKIMSNHSENLVKFFTLAISNPELSDQLINMIHPSPSQFEIEGDEEASEKLGKSEEQMKKLIGLLKEKPNTKQQMTKLQTEIKKHFREETDLRVSDSDSDMALYLFVYYVYHQKGNLQENIEVTANPRNKINKFTDYMKKSQFLTKDLKDFISQNVSKISKFLLSKVAKDILNDTDSPVMITLGNLLPKNPDLKRTVDKLNQGLEKGSDPSPAPKQDGDESAAADEENPEQTPAGDDDDTAAEEEGDPLDRHVKRIRKDIAEYERKAGTGEAKAIMEDFLSQEDAKKLGKDSIEALYSIIEIAKIIVNNFSGEPEEVSESVSKIFNKIKKSANAFMQNQKARSNFSEFEGGFRAYLGHQSEKAKPYLMYLLKFMNGAELEELLKLLYDHNGDITEARKEMKGIHTPSSTDSDVDNLEEALKPIIATMLKEHYNH